MNKILITLFFVAMVGSSLMAWHRKPKQASPANTQEKQIRKAALEKAIVLRNKRCIPCEGGLPSLNQGQEDEFLKAVPQWTMMRDGTHRIKRQFQFKDFGEAIIFVNEIASVVDDQNHHPDISIFYNKVVLEFHTHAIGGLSENDFIVACLIDEMIQTRYPQLLAR